jgi:uncharacterized membrane protein
MGDLMNENLEKAQRLIRKAAKETDGHIATAQWEVISDLIKAITCVARAVNDLDNMK